MNVQKQTSIIAAVLFIFMLILAACPSAYVFLPNEDDRIPPSAFGPADRAKKPQWFVRELGSNDPWGSPGTGIKVSFPHDVELIARSDTPGALIHYESGKTFGKIPNFSSRSPNSNTVTESNPLTLSGSFSKGAYRAAVEAPLVHPSGNSNLIVTLYPDQSPTPLFTRAPGNYDQQSLDIQFSVPPQNSGIYYNSAISPEDTNKNDKIDPDELITPSGDAIVNLSDEHVTLDKVSDPDPNNFPKIEQDDPLSGVITSSFTPDEGYQLYDADNPISLIRGQTACIKAYSAPENYRPSLSILEGCFSVTAAVPNAPTAPALTAGHTQLSASWTAPTNTGSVPLTYHLQYRETGTTPWTDISGITSTNQTIAGLTNGTSYEVRVRAVNGVAAGHWSADSPGTPVVLILTTQTPAGTAATVSLSAYVNTIIANETLTVALTTVEPGTLAVNGLDIIITPATAPAGVTVPTVDSGTGVVAVATSTTAGTYVVYGSETGTGDILFAEYFYVTESPTTNAALDTAVTAGISNWGNTADLNYIITTSVTDMSEVFLHKSVFNGDISLWDTGAVTNMRSMFAGASAFTGDISGWDVRSVRNMRTMFDDANSFNGDISLWDTGAVTDMRNMFLRASAFNADISDWDVSSVTIMYWMFRLASAFNRDISGWDVSSVRDMGSMFYGASSFNQDLEEWKDHWTLGYGNKYTGATADMFNGSGVTGSLIPSWYGPVIATQVPFGTATSIILSTAINNQISTDNLAVSLPTVTTPTTTVTLPTVNATTGVITVTASTTAGTYLVSGETGGGIEQFSEHFYVTESPTTNAQLRALVNTGRSRWRETADLNYIITTAVTSMEQIFNNASSFNGDISLWDTTAVTNMREMFRVASAFNGDISGWNTSSVTSMYNMFGGATTFNGDISRWNTTAVTNMSNMFNNARAFNGDISDWNTTAVTDMSWMFGNYTSGNTFNGNISRWDVSKVTDMSNMFRYSSFNGDISGWDVMAVTNIGRMFQNASAFNQDLEEWKDHWTPETGNKLTTAVPPKYTGTKTSMFASSGVTTPPTWY
ncbi:MAG: BspA family leucine-rich repeat surface protein [Salinispira sp.]